MFIIIFCLKVYKVSEYKCKEKIIKKHIRLSNKNGTKAVPIYYILEKNTESYINMTSAVKMKP